MKIGWGQTYYVCNKNTIKKNLAILVNVLAWLKRQVKFLIEKYYKRSV